MLFALGAASSVLDALQSLSTSKSSSPKATGFNQGGSSPFDLFGSAAATGSASAAPAGSFSQLSPTTLNALFAAQSQSTTATTASAPASPADALKDLFSKIDTNGDGQITKSEFESALGAGGTNLTQADAVFGKLDKNGDGSVSLDEMSSALMGKGGSHHHHHRVAGSQASGDAGNGNPSAGGSNSDPLLQALAGASSTAVTNSDGSTTTSLTYADGSKVTLTSPAASTSSGAATSSYNFLEQMIQRQAQTISAGAPQSLSLRV